MGGIDSLDEWEDWWGFSGWGFEIQRLALICYLHTRIYINTISLKLNSLCSGGGDSGVVED